MKTHTTDNMTEYMKIHLISLYQDIEKYEGDEDSRGYIEHMAAITTVHHLLEYANEL
jgi:hypothetical protein